MESTKRARLLAVRNGRPDQEPGPQVRSIAGRRGGRLALAGTIVLVVVAFAVMVWLTSDAERRAGVEGLVRSPIGLLVLFALAALSTATLILPAPGLALTAIAGAAGDPIVVGVVAGLGQAIGELTGYAAGRSGSALLPDNAATARISGWLKRRGMVVIFVLAVIPNPVFDVAGIAAGALAMPLRRYLGAAASGKVLKNIIVAGGAAGIGGMLAVVVGAA
jgi:uncharacterized membrane protein YdjX (TVP38/TMEM64 family)